MDHPFLTKRHDIQLLAEKLKLCEDILQLLKVTPNDHACIIARRDRDIEDSHVREATLRRSDCIGSLVEMLGKHDNANIPQTLMNVWTNFVMGRKEDTSHLATAVQNVANHSSSLLSELGGFEKDDGESSYSDYSASDSSTSEESDGTSDVSDDDNDDTEETASDI